MFHIRWQKLFNFATSNKVMEDSMTNVLPVVTEIAKESRRYYFDVKKNTREFLFNHQILFKI